MISVSGNGEVEFQFFRPAAQQVLLVGDFNRWDRASLPMQRGRDGSWVRSLRLAPGVYQFKYLADGDWYPDYAAFGLEQGGLGAWNSVVVVSPTCESDAMRAPECEKARSRPETMATVRTDPAGHKRSPPPQLEPREQFAGRLYPAKRPEASHVLADSVR